jgi:hypothetical protein
MSRFSIPKLSNKQYVQSVEMIQGSTGQIITPVSPAYTRPHQTPFMSDHVRAKTNVGVSSTVFDISNGLDPNVNLGVIYSNGYRYQYLDYKAGTTFCQIQVPETNILVQVTTDDGISGYFIQEQTLDARTLVTSYFGNAVVPPLPLENVPTCIGPPISKVDALLVNKNCESDK